MDKNFIKQNKARFHEIVNHIAQTLRNGILPSFIMSLIHLKRMASMFGYSSVISFLQEDEDVLSEKLDNMDETKQQILFNMYQNIDSQLMGTVEQCEETQKDFDEASLIENIVGIFDPDWDPDDEED